MSHDTRAPSRETRVLPGDLGASGGAAPLGGDMAAAGAEGGSVESARQSETWAAAVPPVRAHTVCIRFQRRSFLCSTARLHVQCLLVLLANPVNSTGHTGSSSAFYNILTSTKMDNKTVSTQT